MPDNTRYQILFIGKSTVENFTTKQKAAFIRRQRELTAQGIRFTTWDTRQNALSNMFRF